MKLQSDSQKLRFDQRLSYLYIPILIIFGILAVRLWQLQIVQGSEYALRAERNRIRTIQLVAPRGTISDRYNNPLVENRPSFNILLYRESVKNLEDTKSFVVEKLGIRLEELENRLRRSRGTGLYHPVVIKEDVDINDISVVEAHRRDHPEVQLGPAPRRLYHYGSVAAHVLGTVGEVSDEELSRAVFPGASVGDLVGKSGVERTYHRVLTGQDGRRQVMVDSLGREVGLLEDINSVIGGELQLTLDLNLQLVAEDLLAGKVGTIVAMDPRNGEVLAMASAPSFDPNNFSTRISEQNWNLLINDPDRPLQNRSIQNSYPPGSIFKLVMAETGLQEGFVQDNTRIYCTGAAVYYGRVFHCSAEAGHGSLGLEQAITHSCNIFFYDLGRRMGISKIAQHAHMLGLGERTGIDLPGERVGVVPSAEWKQQVRGSKWYAGETISVSIGQGPVSVTPIQALRLASIIATGGDVVTPHVLLRAEREPEASLKWRVGHLPIESSTARIRDGMWGSVNNQGTGRLAAIAGLDVCGKTGTVQLLGIERRKELQRDLSGREDHSWFVGFASRDNPEIAVVVFLEHGGMGGQAAAPLGRDMILAYYQGKRRPDVLTQVNYPLIPKKQRWAAAPPTAP